MSMRTFFALELDDDIRSRLHAAQQRLRDPSAKIRFVAEENLHVTLTFLGDVDDAAVNDVCSLAGEVASAAEPMEFDIVGISCVPPAGQLRMLWAGATDPNAQMAQLLTDLDAAMGEMGFKMEHRAFNPHITLARIKYCPNPAIIRNAAAPLAGKHFGTQHCTHLTAYTSTLTPAGPIYTPIAKLPLGE